MSRDFTHQVISTIHKGGSLGHTCLSFSKTSPWHSCLGELFLGLRENTAVFQAYRQEKYVLQAFYILARILHRGGHVLVVNTHPDYSKCIETVFLPLKNSQQGNRVSYSSTKWIGGTLTNWKQVSKSVLTFAKFSQRCEKFLEDSALEFPRYKKVKACFQGFLHTTSEKTSLCFREKPDLVVVLNPTDIPGVLHEAQRLHIPVIGFVESTTNLHGITYPLPVSRNCLDFVVYFLQKIVVLVQASERK